MGNGPQHSARDQKPGERQDGKKGGDNRIIVRRHPFRPSARPHKHLKRGAEKKEKEWEGKNLSHMIM